jgi:hypothetical protein
MRRRERLSLLSCTIEGRYARDGWYGKMLEGVNVKQFIMLFCSSKEGVEMRGGETTDTYQRAHTPPKRV